MKLLFKIPSRSRPSQALSLIKNIEKSISNKENYKILLSADKDDPTMYNADFVNSIKQYIESGKLILSFDYSKSSIDAINRDMKLISDYDIIVYCPDDIQFESGFDDKIIVKFTDKFHDTNGKLYFETSTKEILVIGKELYEKQGFIYNPSIKHNLILNYYNDKNTERNEELKFCILENIKNEYIDNIVVICSEADYNILRTICGSEQKLIPIISESRPTFNDYFRIMSRLFKSDDNINIISNLDIIIPPETLSQIDGWDIHKTASDYLTNKKTCLALTRWDITDPLNHKSGSKLYDTPDSQDTWMFVGGVPNIVGADFTLGLAGCDNKISYLLEQNGYNVLNPSRTLKTYHLHLTNIRNYTNIVGHAIERIPPPHKLLHPTE
jgi:hypothetical protein